MLRVTAMFLLGVVLFVAACGEAKENPKENSREPVKGVQGTEPAASVPRPPKRVLVKEEAARKVLERAVASMGGDAALARVKSVKLEYEGSYETTGMRSPFKSEMLYVAPDRLLWTLDAGTFKGAAGTAGGVSWSRFLSPVGRAKGAQAESIAEWPNHQAMFLIRPLLHRDDVSLRMDESKTGDRGGEETVHVGFGGKNEYAVTFITRDGKTFARRIEGPQTHMDGRRGTVKLSLSRPKEFEGITLPTGYAAEAYVGGRLDHSTTELLMAVEWNPEVPEDAFAMPALMMEPDKVFLKQTEAMYGLVVVHEGSYANLAETFGRALSLAGQSGAAFLPSVICVYLNDPSKVADPSELRTEVTVPLMVMGPPPTAPEGAEIRAIPELTVVAMVVRGPYGTQEGKVIGKLLEWAAENEKTPAGRPRVVYYHNPALVVDEDQVSEIQIPLK